MGMTKLHALTRAWDLLSCSGSNDLTHEKLDVFEVYFRRLQSKLHGVTENQAYEKLMTVLPVRNVTTLHRKEAEISRDETISGCLQSTRTAAVPRWRMWSAWGAASRADPIAGSNGRWGFGPVLPCTPTRKRGSCRRPPRWSPGN